MTEVHIHINDGRPTSMRRHVQLPANAGVVHDWWAAQGNVSSSVQLLVLEEISKHGITDRLMRAAAPAPVATAAAPAPAAPAPAAPASPTTPATPSMPAVPIGVVGAGSAILTAPAPIKPQAQLSPEAKVAVDRLNAEIEMIHITSGVHPVLPGMDASFTV